MTLEEKISEFERRNPKIKIVLGGDGTFLAAIRELPKKIILPIRDYGNCSQHIADDILDKLLANDENLSLKMSIMPQIELDIRHGIDSFKAVSEIILKNRNITEAARFDVYLNGNLCIENVICDGVIAATPLGSHGYFKSVARTIFYDGIGLAFIAPTYSLNNMVLRPQDKVVLKVKREGDIFVSRDKDFHEEYFRRGDEFSITQSSDNISVLGYDMFMCSECRRGRNSTIINDQYVV